MKILWIFLLHGCVSSTISSTSWTLPGGGPLFPYGDQTGKTDYRCEGDNMTISCLDDDEDGSEDEDDRRIEVVRGNFGRFSIAICNQHGHTDWSVNCMSPSTTKRLKTKCDGLKTCTISVDSTSFPEDSCPGTSKYLEVHYVCTSIDGGAGRRRGKNPPPPWLNPWFVGGSSSSSVINGSASSVLSSTTESTSTTTPRKPILVTDKAQTERIPITTPKVTTDLPIEPSTSSVVPPSFTSDVAGIVVSTPHIFRENGKRKELIMEESTVKMNNRRRKIHHKSVIFGSQNDDNDDDNFGDTEFIGDESSACPPTTARNLQWNWTKIGEFAIQPCPIGTTGLARWSCGSNGQWSSPFPDMSDCKAVAMSNLEAQVRAEDPENVLISSLAYLTSTKSLYGGDLESSVAIMRTVANLIQYRLQSHGDSFRDKESLIGDVLRNVIRSVTHILQTNNRRAWTDLSNERQMKVATSLLLSLEENAFLLAGVMDHPDNSMDSSELLTMAIYVIGTDNAQSNNYQVFFPPTKLQFVEDNVLLSSRDIAASRSQFSQLTEVVFFSFANLHQVLTGADIRFSRRRYNQLGENDKKQWYLNSRVVSASLGRGGRHVELIDPVIITLKHLQDNMTDPVCVFWNYETHGWSDAGCWLHSTNTTHSVCHCEHLTNFALVMRPSPVTHFPTSSSSASSSSNIMTVIQIASIVSVFVIVLLIIVVLVTVKFGGNMRKWCGKRNCCGKSAANATKSIRGTGTGGVGVVVGNGTGTGTGNTNAVSDMEKCQRNFYTGLSTSKVMSTLNERQQALSQYVLANHGGTLLMSSSSTGGTSSGSTLSSIDTTATKPLRANNISSSVPHITLNPYSSQLVDHLNMMMPPPPPPPPKQHQQNDVVYRAVSPHGHVYWEIDPAVAQSMNYYSEANNVEIEDTIRRNAAESHPLMAFHHHQQQLQQQLQQQQQQQHHQLRSTTAPRGQLSTSSTFFNTRSAPFMTMSRNNNNNEDSQQQQQAVPEQLQRQVQIRDIKSIPVSVKSSEYIEAKIRTLRASSHRHNHHQHNHTLPTKQQMSGH